MSARDFILALPQQIAEGRKLGKSYSLSKPYRRIIACGMGGSGIPVELMSVIDTRILPWHDFSLPGDAGTQDIVVCISWSGNTAETISSYQEARTRNIDVLVITKDDSKLGQMAKTDGTKIIELPDENQPSRFASGYATGALAELTGHAAELNLLSLIPKQFEQEGEQIAEMINQKIPTVYVSQSVRALGPIWKMLFNESAKIHADWNSFPELTHNELAEFSAEDAGGFLPIIIKNPTENTETLNTIEQAIAFMQEIGYTVYTVILFGSTLLEKVLNGFLLSLWVSCSLARRLGVDPMDIQITEAFKKRKGDS